VSFQETRREESDSRPQRGCSGKTEKVYSIEVVKLQFGIDVPQNAGVVRDALPSACNVTQLWQHLFI